MRILCLVKRVPDSRAAIKARPDGRGIDEAGLKHVCDPFDEFGVEQAVRLKEARGDVQEVVAIGLGGAETAEVLRFALAMGAQRAVHVMDEASDPRDELRLAAVLAAAIRRRGGPFDLILCGKQAIDNDAGELGPALAEHLDLPHIGAVTRLEVAVDGRSVRVSRRIEGAEEVLEARLPVLLTCEKGLVEPRYPPLPRLMKARKEPLETISAAALEGLGDLPRGAAFEKLAPPAARPPCRFVEGDPDQMARELVRLLREEAKVI